MSSLDTSEISGPITRVTLSVDGQTAYTSGNDTGRAIEKQCPWATQEMCDQILAKLSSVSYQPFSGVGALTDPAAETGDGITIGGVYSVLAHTDILFDALYTADVSAPGGDEVEDEYPYKSRARRQSDRELAQVRSSIKKTASEITLLVEDTAQSISSEFSVKLDSITSTVNGLNGQVSSIKQYVDNITLSVSNGSTSSTITLKSGSTTISSQNITMSGLVTFTGLSSGTTTIDGSCIKTGTISASRVDLSNYSTTGQTNATIYSSIQALQNGLSLQVYNDVNRSTITLTSNGIALASRDITFTGMVTFNDLSGNAGTVINGSAINTSTLQLDRLFGNSIFLMTPYGEIATEIRTTGASTARTAFDLWARAVRINSNEGDLYLHSDMAYVTLAGAQGNTCIGNFSPNVGGAYSCGTGWWPWSDIYANNSVIQTSDRAAKEEIAYGLDQYDALFDALRPASFRFKDGTSGRTHLGMIAQDVEEALEAAGLTDTEFAGFVRSPEPKSEGVVHYGLRYGEFIAILIEQVQKLKARVAKLEGGISND